MCYFFARFVPLIEATSLNNSNSNLCLAVCPLYLSLTMWTRKAAECEMCRYVCWQMCVLLLFMLLGAALGATPFAKEYRSAGLFKGNTLIDMELDAATTLDMGAEKLSSSSGVVGEASNSGADNILGFKAESSVVLPGVQLNAGEFR